MKNINGFPGIGTAGKDGIKGNNGITNYFVNDTSVKDFSHFTNNSFIYNKRLEKFLKNENTIKKLFSYSFYNNFFTKKGNVIIPLYNIIFTEDYYNKILKNNYNLNLLSGNNNLLSFFSKEEKSVLHINNDNHFIIDNKVPFIIKSNTYSKDKNKQLLKNFEDKIIENFLQIEKNTSKNEIKITLSSENLIDILLKNVEISLIINGTFDGTSYNEERVIKPYDYDKILLNEIIFKMDKSIVSNYDYSLYYKIKVIQEIPIEKNEGLSSNFFTLYKKIHNEKSEE